MTVGFDQCKPGANKKEILSFEETIVQLKCRWMPDNKNMLMSAVYHLENLDELHKGVKKCKDIEIQGYEHEILLTTPFARADGQTRVCVDMCLADELYDLWYNKKVKTVGCCCGHDKFPAYIQVSPEFCDKMKSLKYEEIPPNPDGTGVWCFVPKTILRYQEDDKK